MAFFSNNQLNNFLFFRYVLITARGHTFFNYEGFAFTKFQGYRTVREILNRQPPYSNLRRFRALLQWFRARSRAWSLSLIFVVMLSDLTPFVYVMQSSAIIRKRKKSNGAQLEPTTGSRNCCGLTTATTGTRNALNYFTRTLSAGLGNLTLNNPSF